MMGENCFLWIKPVMYFIIIGSHGEDAAYEICIGAIQHRWPERTHHAVTEFTQVKTHLNPFSLNVSRRIGTGLFLVRLHHIKGFFLWVHSISFLYACRPHYTHLDEPLTRANQTITHPLWWRHAPRGQPRVTCCTSRALGADPGEPLEWRQSYSNKPGADQGRPGEANQSHP